MCIGSETTCLFVCTLFRKIFQIWVTECKNEYVLNKSIKKVPENFCDVCHDKNYPEVN